MDGTYLITVFIVLVLCAGFIIGYAIAIIQQPSSEEILAKEFPSIPYSNLVYSEKFLKEGYGDYDCVGITFIPHWDTVCLIEGYMPCCQRDTQERCVLRKTNCEVNYTRVEGD